MRLCFDIETDGLLDELTKVHCMAAQDVDTGEAYFWDPSCIEEGIKFLQDASLIIAHNGINFDVRAIQKVYPWFKSPKIYDTIILAKMIWPSDILFDTDYKRFKTGRLDWKFVKRYSLEAWGNRLGAHKGDFGKTADWKNYTPEMGEYNKQDVVVNVALWKLIEKRLGWNKEAPPEDGFVWSELCVDTEMAVAAIICEQETVGYGFDRDKAIKLAQQLGNNQADIEDALVQHFGEWWEPLDDPDHGAAPATDRREKLSYLPDVATRRYGKTGKELAPRVGPPLCEYSKDAPFVRIARTVFNPSSRTHLGSRLVKDFGWKPTKFGGKDGDIPTVDEGTLKEIPEDVLPASLRSTILNYFVVTKTLAMLSKGKQSWLGNCDNAGRIHGRMDTLGAITSRGTHSNPNLGQVPSVSLKETKDEAGKVIKKEPILGIDGGYGWESRDLFKPGIEGWEQTGTDASGLELRNLGHEMFDFDGGVFAKMISDPALDPHTENGKLTGLTRADTKTVTYAFLYGAGPLKVGQAVGVKKDEIPELLASSELTSYLNWMQNLAKRERKPYVRPDDTTCAFIAKGSRIIAAFLGGISGLKEFRKATVKEGEKGWIAGLDGRKVFVRKAHATVNTKLQSSGAIICKMWMVETHRLLNEQGLMPRRDFNQMAWVHDELQFEHRPGLGDIIGKTSKQAIQNVAKALDYRAALAADFKCGRSWAECH